MAERQWLVEGVQVYETGDEEFFVEGLQLCENQADTGEVSIPILAYHYNHHLGSMG